MRTTRILPVRGAGSFCAQLSGRDSLSVYCVLRARRLRHRRRIARGSQEQSATAARRHLDSRTAMGPVRRPPPTARLDALAAGPATARSGRPYPCQALGRRRPARGSISTAERAIRPDQQTARPGLLNARAKSRASSRSTLRTWSNPELTARLVVISQ